MKWVVAYDLESDAVRARVAELLLTLGERVQKSVFECVLEADEVEALTARLQREIGQTPGNVRVYRLCSACLDASFGIGATKATVDEQNCGLVTGWQRDVRFLSPLEDRPWMGAKLMRTEGDAPPGETEAAGVTRGAPCFHGVAGERRLTDPVRDARFPASDRRPGKRTTQVEWFQPYTGAQVARLPPPSRH
jgi:CRISPR-associated protein Cas2